MKNILYYLSLSHSLSLYLFLSLYLYLNILLLISILSANTTIFNLCFEEHYIM